MTSFPVCSLLQSVRVNWVKTNSLTFSPVLQTFKFVVEAPPAVYGVCSKLSYSVLRFFRVVKKYLMSKFTLVTGISYRTVGEAFDIKLKAVVSVIEPVNGQRLEVGTNIF